MADMPYLEAGILFFLAGAVEIGVGWSRGWKEP